MVIERIVTTHLLGREIGHDDIRTRKDTPLTPSGIDGGKRCRRGQQEVGLDEAQQRQEVAAQLCRASWEVAKRRRVVRHERPNATHLWMKRLDELEVCGKLGTALVGRAHHEAGPHDKADVLEVTQAAEAMLKRETARMETGVVGRRRRLMAQKIAIGPRIKESSVALVRALAQRERDGAVRVGALNPQDERDEPRVIEQRILPSLQDEGPEAQLVPLVTTAEDLGGRQAVAPNPTVTATNAAVVAVVPTVVGYLDEPTDEDGVTKIPATLGVGACGSVDCKTRRECLDEPLVVSQRQGVPLGQLVYETEGSSVYHICSFASTTTCAKRLVLDRRPILAQSQVSRAHKQLCPQEALTYAMDRHGRSWAAG